MAKWVYKFHEGSAAMRNLLGGKGCNLAEMTNLGMPIPQGFTVTTEACTEYYNCGKQISQEIQDQIFEAITWLEGINGKKFGDTEDPLLVSVRSGARASMPGMMDTILNLGLNEEVVESRDLQRRPATQDLLTIPTADSSRCILTLLWKFQSPISRRSSMR